MLTRSTILGGAGDRVLQDVEFRLLLLANIIAVLGTTLLSPVLSSLIHPLNASAANIGLVMSVFTAPGIVMIPVTGYAADRYGRKPVITGGLLLFGAAGLAISFVNTFHEVLFLRLFQGMGYAGIVPIVIAAIGDLYVAEEETAAQGLRFMTSGLSMTIFPPLAAVLVVIGWRYPFLLYALAIPIAIVIHFFFTEPDLSAPVGDGGITTGGLKPVLAVAFKPALFSIFIARGLAAVVLIGFITYNSIIVVDIIGRSVGETGIVVGANSIAFALTASQVGRVTEWLSTRYVPLLIGTFCLGLGFSIVGIAPTLPVVFIGTLLLGVGVGLTQALYRSIVTATAPDAVRGGVVSVAETIGRIATSLTPIVMGLAIDLSTPILGFNLAVRATAVGISVSCAIGGLACLLLWHHTGNDPEY